MRGRRAWERMGRGERGGERGGRGEGRGERGGERGEGRGGRGEGGGEGERMGVVLVSWGGRRGEEEEY